MAKIIEVEVVELEDPGDGETEITLRADPHALWVKYDNTKWDGPGAFIPPPSNGIAHGGIYRSVSKSRRRWRKLLEHLR